MALLNLDAFLPAVLIFWIPSTFRTIQDGTHLMLVIGLVIGMILIVINFSSILSISKMAMHPIEYMEDVVDLIFLVPTTLLLMQMMGYYDDRMQTRLKEVGEQKGKLSEAYADMIVQMDGMLGRAADSSAGLAEKNFTGHRRDFIVFLERLLKRYKQQFPNPPMNDGERQWHERFLKEFRSMVRHWLKAFEEASINPEEFPLTIESFPNEFEMFRTLETLIETVVERLKATDMKIVSGRASKDEEEVNKCKAAAEGHGASDVLAIPSQNSGMSGQSDALQVGLTNLREMSSQGVDTPGRCAWCKCGGAGCGLSSMERGERFPMSVGCLVCGMEIMCREHLIMVAGIALGLGLTFFNVIIPFVDGSDATTGRNALTEGAPLLIYTACLLVLVSNIESIVAVLRLEREVAHMKEEQTRVDVVQTEMHNFWDNVQELTDIWLFRTIPRLDLYKEMNIHLGDTEPTKMIAAMEDMNKHLAVLEANIGTLQQWRGNAQLEASKGASQGGGDGMRKIGDGVRNVIRSSHTGSMEELMKHLDKELSDHHKGLLSKAQQGALTQGSGGKSATAPPGSSVEMASATAVRY